MYTVSLIHYSNMDDPCLPEDPKMFLRIVFSKMFISFCTFHNRPNAETSPIIRSCETFVHFYGKIFFECCSNWILISFLPNFHLNEINRNTYLGHRESIFHHGSPFKFSRMYSMVRNFISWNSSNLQLHRARNSSRCRNKRFSNKRG